MSELMRETLNGFVGKRIRDDLLALKRSLNDATLRCIRDGTKPYDESRYKAGLAEGVQIALNHAIELGQLKD